MVECNQKEGVVFYAFKGVCSARTRYKLLFLQRKNGAVLFFYEKIKMVYFLPLNYANKRIS